MWEREMLRAGATKEPFRSERMVLVQIMLQREAAHDSVEELAELGCVQFVDSDANEVKTAFQRAWVTEVRLCDDMLRQLRLFRARATSLGLAVDTRRGYETSSDEMTALPLSLDDLSAQFSELERELKEVEGRERQMTGGYEDKLQHRRVVERALQDGRLGLAQGIPLLSIDSAGGYDDDASAMEEGVAGQATGEARMGEGPVGQGAVRITWGVVDADKKEAFERLLWRSTRGNAILNTAHQTSSLTEEAARQGLQRSVASSLAERASSDDKLVFAVFCSSAKVHDKVGRLCQAMEAKTFAVPRDQTQQIRLLESLAADIRDFESVSASAKLRQTNLLSPLAAGLAAQEARLLKEKAVYATLNLCNVDITPKTVVAEGWVPVCDLDRVRAALLRGMRRSGANTPSVMQVLETEMTPPTLIKTNKLTESFQALNDAYGTPRYRELNPGTFYPITYAFLFGIMFGDIGHGMLLLLAALFLISREHAWSGKALNELIAPAFDGRYVLLLMALFSIYVGFVYNECFGISLLPWSYWSLDCPEGGVGGSCAAMPIAPPGFGVDPIWGIAENKLGYQNSFKMKISIIIGVSQMVFGLACKTSNCFYFKKWKDLLFENIPEYIFLLSIFGYLCVIIVYKWSVDWVGLGLVAPPLLDTLLGMLLNFGQPIEPEMVLFPGQATLQTILVSIAVLAVPCMLLPKPLLLRAEHKDGYAQLDVDDKTETSPRDEGQLQHGDFDFADCMIHQSIHVIEFVLGSVSNTASYLRLWALSLAHGGLSEVFWERVILQVLELDLSPHWMGVCMFFAFAVWACLTFGVLMVMETLSACLHDIRLHWVEFQNKFYAGDGRRFEPLSFKAIIHEHIHGAAD